MGDERSPVLAPPRAQTFRRAWAQVDLEAVRHNTRLLRRISAPAELCAVVKANGYGHGALEVARAALEGGATWLAVATVEEGVELREGGADARVLVLSEPPPPAMEEVVARSLTPTLYTIEGVRSANQAASRAGSQIRVHVKVDTGMHRVGADPGDLPALLDELRSSDALALSALWTHLAVADGTSDTDRNFTALQLERFALASEQARHATGSRSEPIMAHAANSAGAICHPASRFDMVRCGIALYGSLPAPELAGLVAEAAGLSSTTAEAGGGLRPAMSLRAEVVQVRRLEAGERPSYGRLRPLAEPSLVATVPLGYADGVPRSYFEAGGTVLVGGVRRRLAGAVTMDQIIVDCGADWDVSVGDEVVLIGDQGGETITAWDWAEALGTISYEVLSRIGPRVERVYLDQR